VVGIGHRGDREVHAAERRDLARPAGVSISGVRTSYGQDEIREVARRIGARVRPVSTMPPSSSRDVVIVFYSVGVKPSGPVRRASGLVLLGDGGPVAGLPARPARAPGKPALQRRSRTPCDGRAITAGSSRSPGHGLTAERCWSRPRPRHSKPVPKLMTQSDPLGR
jgi:hypothetical protein